MSLKRHMKMMLGKAEEPLDQLELADNLQRLGVSYHFEDEINRALEIIYNNNGSDDKWHKEDLYATTLQFRLLRQHGYNVPQEVLNFRDNEGNSKPNLCEDIKGTLSLYEASHIAVGGESILERAREFTTKHWKEKLDEQKIDQNVAILVWTMPWSFLYIPDMNPMLLELAKLDFNMLS